MHGFDQLTPIHSAGLITKCSVGKNVLFPNLFGLPQAVIPSSPQPTLGSPRFCPQARAGQTEATRPQRSSAAISGALCKGSEGIQYNANLTSVPQAVVL